jgi:hypothetical protein
MPQFIRDVGLADELRLRQVHEPVERVDQAQWS